MGGQRPVACGCPVGSVLGRLEAGEERVTRVVYDASAGCDERLAEEPIVIVHDLRGFLAGHCAEQRRVALQVGEEERERAGRKLSSPSGFEEFTLTRRSPRSSSSTPATSSSSKTPAVERESRI